MGDDDDLAFALFLQEQLNNENSEIVPQKQSNVPTSLVDPSWELIDPNPDIRQLFLQFNQEYFDGMLGGVEVRWSPRMTLCAGLCCYEGRGGLCSVRLSEPLLKLRPRKDLVETLLHEMIHALLFVTQNNKDHDGHGPEFHKHMYRINKQAGTNISVYHNFHDEVNAYRQHWWKCNGPCQKWPPFYGVVKRAMNRAPAPRDMWWDDHKRKCGGEFTKVKEPENYGKRKSKKKDKLTEKGKGKSVNSDSKPNLPTFFDKMKKNQTSDNSCGEVDKKGTSKYHGNMSDSDSSDDNLETSTKKPKIDNSLPPGFQVFSGRGHVLGGSKTDKVENNRVQNPLGVHNTNDKPTCKATTGVHNTNDKPTCKATTTSKQTESNSSLDFKKGSHNGKASKKKTAIPSLTIIDAFARGKKTVEDSVTGSKEKPINLCEDSSNDVPCPSCQSFIPLHMINNHLDGCLTSA